MSQRTKIPLVFVLATLNKFQQVPDWYLKIDWQNNALVEQLQMANLAHSLWRASGHIEKLGVLTDIYFRANQTNAVELIKGKRDGWIVQRTGGCCTSPFKVYETKVIEIDTPKVLDDPKQSLLDAWPMIIEDASVLIRDVKISQWPSGTHWYARLSNGIDVEILGKSKWDSYDDAMEATRMFVALLQIKAEEKNP